MTARRFPWGRLCTAAVLLAATTVAGAGTAAAATPTVGLGTATSFAVLAGTTVTNTGPSVITGDVGVSAGSAITGFPPGLVTGAFHAADAVADLAQSDLVTAYNDAAGRTPDSAVPADLAGLVLVDGVYGGPTLELTGTVTLDAQGDPDAVFIFQSSSTLITASNSVVALINGADPCNVFWQIGSSATLGTDSTFVGNVLALTSITAQTSATITGRLLARNGATTLDSNVISAPNCPVVTPGTTTTAVTTTTTPGSTAPPATTTPVGVTPVITSGAPPAASPGTPYAFAVTATGSPAPTFSVSTGELPAGLSLDATTGVIAGTPTTGGTFTFTVTASNAAGQDSTTLMILVATGVNAPTPPNNGTLPTTGTSGASVTATLATFLVALGTVLLLIRRRIRPATAMGRSSDAGPSRRA